MRYKAAVFDMDGTILNTLDDLTGAIDHALHKTGHLYGWTDPAVAEFFGSGIRVAIRRALACEAALKAARDDRNQSASAAEKTAEGAPLPVLLTSKELEALGAQSYKETPETAGEIDRVIEVFTPYYAAHCAEKTGPYPGIPEVIRRLREAGVLTAVVSNKQNGAVQILARDYFPGLFDMAVGEMPGVRRKPAPDMTDKFLKEYHLSTGDAVYIGDSEVDMQTAENAGLPCISVEWGFRSHDFLIRHGAKTLVTRPEEIADLILS